MRVVVTGAAGRIGTEIVKELSGRHDLCLVDRAPVPGRASVVCDLAQGGTRSYFPPWRKTRPPRWAEAFEGANIILHLAAEKHPHASWQRVLHDNITAAWNVI